MKRFFFTLVLFLTVALAPPTWAAEPDIDSYGQQVVEFLEGLTNQFLSFFAPEPVELEAASGESTTDPDPLTDPDPEGGGGAGTNSSGGGPEGGGDPDAGTITYPGG